MKNTLKRMCLLVMALCLVIGMSPAVAFATENEPEAVIGEALNDLYDVLKNITADSLREDAEKLADVIKDHADELKDVEPEDLVEAVKNIDTDALIEAVKDAYNDATHDDYNLDCCSSYVAMGDTNAKDNYSDVVAEYLNIYTNCVDGVAYIDLMEGGLEMYQADDVVANNIDAIKSADLITLGYGSNVYTSHIVSQLTDYMAGTYTSPDYAAIVGEEYATYIKAAAAKVADALEAVGIDGTYGDAELSKLLLVTIESYAYSYISYVYHLPTVIEAISAANPDAVIAVVGMHNPLSGVSVAVNNETSIPVGLFTGMLAEATNVFSTAYALVDKDITYVEARNVEVINTKTEFTVLEFALEYIQYKGANMEPTAAGHDYIADQILAALNISKDECVPYYRLSGETRFETAIEVADDLKAELGVDKFDSIIIAYGMNFPDALAGSYLSTALNAPILLSIDEDFPVASASKWLGKTLAYVEANLAEGGTIYMLGGDAVIADETAAKFSAYNVVRLYGANRFETNMKILEQVAAVNGEQDTVLICTGKAAWDNLSASAVGLPIMLVYNELYDYQKEYLQGKNFIIVGGSAAVSESIEAELKELGTVETRFSGKTRVETSVLVAEHFFGSKAVMLANALAFPDALCGGVLAYNKHMPIIMSCTGFETAPAVYVAANNVNKGIILGGTGALTDATVRTVYGLADDYVVPYK